MHVEVIEATGFNAGRFDKITAETAVDCCMIAQFHGSPIFTQCCIIRDDIMFKFNETLSYYRQKAKRCERIVITLVDYIEQE